eukprot:XP_001699107.1 predicted protein [Chlamydomonas reinhardtii]
MLLGGLSQANSQMDEDRAQQREQLRTALRACGADLTLFDDIFLDKLWDNYYRSVRGLQDARHESLIAAGLPLGLVDHISRLQASLGDGGARSTASAEDPTAAYLEDCLKTPAGGRGTLCQLLLHGNVEALWQCLATPVTPGLPLPPLAAQLPGLRHNLVPETQQAAPDELAMHVYSTVCDNLKPAGAGCSSEMYTAFLTHRLLERTLWLIAKHRKAAWLEMDRNVAVPVEPQASTIVWTTQTHRRNKVVSLFVTVRLQRPAFMVWVKKALLFKGQEKAALGDLRLAVDELTSHTTEAWASGLLPTVQRPCMLAYAAAGSRIQDYAESGQPAPEFAIGQSIESAGSHVSFHPGYVRKAIPQYREIHERYVSFELLEKLYERLQSPQHRHAIIKACKPPRLDADGTYVVHLAPLGTPCTGPPDNEEELAAAVAGVLRGLAALHAEGYVHRDVRWANVIYLPEDGRWMLIDLELAGLEGCDCSRSPFPLRYWSPRTLPLDKKYRAASDLRMTAEQLMCGAGSFSLSEAGVDLRDKLMRAVEEDTGGSSGLTAEQALKHPWLRR